MTEGKDDLETSEDAKNVDLFVMKELAVSKDRLCGLHLALL